MPRHKQIRPETKYYSPRLLAALESLSSYPLTLLEAPSGFGKTTALRYFSNSRMGSHGTFYWYAFQEEKPEEAWKDLCGIIRNFDPVNAERLLAVGLPEQEALPRVGKILRELKCAEETYLILDNFHHWKLRDPGQFLMLLSGHGARKLRIVVATQPLSREQHKVIVQSSRFFLLQDNLLTFDAEEVAAYYHKAGVDLPQEQIEQVARMTQGWVMALYLQLLSLVKTGEFEKGGMEGLMRNALWNRLTNKECRFLLEVSIFPSFTLSQAAAIGGLSLEEAENLLREKRFFVNFDKEKHTYHFHSLFRRFLQAQFALLPEERRREIYLAGGKLAAQDPDNRIHMLRFYYLAHAWEEIYAMPLTGYDIVDVIEQETKPMILDLLEHAPVALKKKYPAAMVPLAFSLFFMNENEKLAAMEHEINGIIEQSALTQAEKNALLGEMELLYSFQEYNRIDSMSARHRKALALLGGPAKLINLKDAWTFGSPSVLYLFYRESGKLEEELKQLEESLPIYSELTDGHGTGGDNMMRAEAQFMRGAFDAAEVLCYQAMYGASRKKQNSIGQCGLFLLARIAVARGDKTQLETHMQSFYARSRQQTEDLCRYAGDLVQGFFAVTTGRPDDVPHWLAESELIARRLIFLMQPFAYIINIRLLLEQKKYNQLLGACEYLMGIATVFPNLLAVIYCRIYMAEALYAVGDSAKALAVLEEALEEALPDQIYMPFAENYEGLAPLLPAAAKIRHGEGLAPIRKLSRQMQDAVSVLYTPKIELTAREQEVFALVKRGLNNGEIAAELHISINTAKNILKHIYKKTNVSTKARLALLELK